MIIDVCFCDVIKHWRTPITNNRKGVTRFPCDVWVFLRSSAPDPHCGVNSPRLKFLQRSEQSFLRNKIPRKIQNNWGALYSPLICWTFPSDLAVARACKVDFMVPKILKGSKSFRYVTQMELKHHQISVVYVPRLSTSYRVVLGRHAPSEKVCSPSFSSAPSARPKTRLCSHNL